ncbi:hypothetical protein BGX38DRAFT_1273435 [Terfezia claveryi]|nr:hypothetical protein BGX38DRAFT_1273435 [Terfezia claveryi]
MRRPRPANPSEPCDPLVRLEFHAWLANNQEHSNRFRISPNRLQMLHHFVLNPDQPSHSVTERKMKHVAKSYRLDGNGKLLRLPEPPRHPTEREVVLEEDIFQIIWSLHCELGHAGKNRMFPIIGDRYYGITREEVMWVLRRCHICARSGVKSVTCGCSVQHTCHTKESLSGQRDDDEALREGVTNSSRDDFNYTTRSLSTELIDASGNSDQSTKQANKVIKSVGPAVGESYESPTLPSDSISDWETRSQTGKSTVEPKEGMESHRGSAARKRPASPPEMVHYTCDVCGKEYPTRPKLTWHRKIHGMTGEAVEWSAWR